MAKGIKISGIPDLKRSMNNLSKQLSKAVDKSISEGAKDIVSMAKGLCRDKEIASTIHMSKLKDHTWSVDVDSTVAAYEEFGTGNYAAIYVPSVPKDWQDYAKTFFINGKGRTPANPFLYPSFDSRKKGIVESITL